MALQFYPALIVHQPGTAFGAVFPDFPGCISAGDTLGQAAEMAVEALAVHVEGLREDGATLPDPSGLEGRPDWLDADQIAARVLIPLEPATKPGDLLDEALLAKVDQAAAAEGSDRSGFVAAAVRDRLTRMRAA